MPAQAPDDRWTIEMLGGLRARRAAWTVTHFRTHKTGALLAFLAHHPAHPHPRETLIELLWPGSDPDAGRNSLSAALSSLRQQLEPPGVAAGSVIRATRAAVGLAADATTTDVAAFESSIAEARAAKGAARAAALDRAVGLYAGELLPGHYHEWILAERERLRAIHVDALRGLVAHHEAAGDLGRALDLARRAVTAEPLGESAQRDLARILARSGEPAAALKQLRDLEQRLSRELGAKPSVETLKLAKEIERGLPRAASAPVIATPPVAQPTTRSAARVAEPPRAPAPEPAAHVELPLTLGRLFGRDAELARAREEIVDRGTRLLTIIGPGGIGKTRLAIEVARASAQALRGAVRFVALDDVTDARVLPGAILDALRIPRSTDRPEDPLETLISALRAPGDARTLLLLDSFEQLVDGGAAVVAALLARVPGLSCLVTSRRRLMISGEREVPVAPLDVPSESGMPAEIEASPAVRLFVEHAQTVRPGFALTPENARDVAALARRFEGIPLALRLAAGRAHVLTPAQILERTGQRLSLPEAREHDTARRHRTLRAAIEWSHRLLSPALQRFFGSVSVFRGSFTADAAEVVCDEPDALDRLSELGECSLLETDSLARGFRFRLLETLREFAAEQCLPDERDALARRHAEHYRALAERAVDGLRGPKQTEWMERMEAERDNIRAALSWARDAAEGERIGLRLSARMSQLWRMRGQSDQPRAASADGLPGSSTERAAALEAAALLAQARGDLGTARDRFEEALSIHRARGAQGGVAVCLSGLGATMRLRGELGAARALLEEALGSARAAGEDEVRASVLSSLGDVARRLGDRGRARAAAEEALLLERGREKPRNVAAALANLAMLRSDDLDAARGHLDESLAILREVGDQSRLSAALAMAGRLRTARGDLLEARAALDESLSIARRLSLKRVEAEALVGKGSLSLCEGRAAEARATLDAATNLQRVCKHPVGEALALVALGDAARALGEDEAAGRCYRNGLRAMGAQGEPPLAGAGCLEGLAALARKAGDATRAAVLLGAAAAPRAGFGEPLHASILAAIDAEHAATRAALGDAAFEESFVRGRVMKFADVVALAISAT